MMDRKIETSDKWPLATYTPTRRRGPNKKKKVKPKKRGGIKYVEGIKYTVLPRVPVYRFRVERFGDKGGCTVKSFEDLSLAQEYASVLALALSETYWVTPLSGERRGQTWEATSSGVTRWLREKD